MNDLKKLQPKALEPTGGDLLSLPLYFKSYSELSFLIGQLTTGVHVIAYLMQEGTSLPVEQIGQGLEGVTTVLSSLTSAIDDDICLLDKLRTLNNK